LLGWCISTLYKVFTGRGHPSEFIRLVTDITHQFQFGLFQGGIVWGWPSSHTTVAFATAAAVWTMYPHKKFLKVLAAIFAVYIGVSVSATIHWFSDFAAGAILGIVIGRVVGRSFRRHIAE
jgi:membrane-associated phospholipid phosphatase